MENTCINCGAPVVEKFCSACGQRAGVKRLTFREGWFDFWSRVYGFDGMFPRTLRDLTIRPGQVARDYIAGNRVKYYGPVGYFFFMISLVLLIFSLVGLDFAELMQQSAGLQQAPAPGSGQAEFARIFMQKIADNMRLFSFVIVPIMALWCRLVFRKSGYNLLEHSIVPFYTNGHIFLVTLIFGLLYHFAQVPFNQVLSLLVGVAYQVFAFINFYQYQARWKVAIKAMLAYVLAYFTFMLVITVAMTVYVLTDPAAREMLRPSNNP